MEKILQWAKQHLAQSIFILAIFTLLALWLRKEIIDLTKEDNKPALLIDSTEMDRYRTEMNAKFEAQQQQYERLLKQSQNEVIESIQERNSINKNRPNAQTTIDYIHRVNDANRHSIAQSIIRHLDSLNASGSQIVRGYPPGKFEGN